MDKADDSECPSNSQQQPPLSMNPDPESEALPDGRILSYLYCFNHTQDYFACHEYGESLWLDTGRPTVLKGLIQAAVCLYHLHGGNVRGGRRMWRGARTYLLNHGARSYEGIDLVALVRDIDDVFARVPAKFTDQVVDPARIANLNLPTVVVRVVDPQVQRALTSWQPPGEDDSHPPNG